MAAYRDPFSEVRRKAIQAFEQPESPFAYGRPSDLFVIKEGDGYHNWDTLHLWVDDEQRSALARRIFWRSLFDSQRLRDPGMGARYGQAETPSLVISDYAPSYEALQSYRMALFGAIPSPSRAPTIWEHDDSDDESAILRVMLRLPLSNLYVFCKSYEGEWGTLIQAYHELHAWILTTPRVSSSLKP